jgi:hypothetical protein
LEELVVCTWAHDPAVRARSFELLAQVFALRAPEANPLRMAA